MFLINISILKSLLWYSIYKDISSKYPLSSIQEVAKLTTETVNKIISYNH